jgi:nucleoside-diphosphate-sugar epimerase
MEAPEIPAGLAQPLLVTGATSLIGRQLMPRLEASSVTVFGFSRQADASRAGWVRGDLASPDLERQLPVAQTVLSLQPIWHLPQALPSLKAKGIQRLVAFSSTSVIAKAASPDAYEQSVVRRLVEAETAVQAFCEANAVAWTILRPTLIYAEGEDQNVTRLARLIRKLGFLPLYGQGQGRRQPVHAADLAQAALEAAVSPRAVNRAYDLPGGETLTYREMVERVFEGMGRRPRILAAPEWLWGLGFALARPLLPGATAQMGARMAEDLVFDDHPARADFNWNPRGFRPDFKTIA